MKLDVQIPTESECAQSCQLCNERVGGGGLSVKLPGRWLRLVAHTDCLVRLANEIMRACGPYTAGR